VLSGVLWSISQVGPSSFPALEYQQCLQGAEIEYKTQKKVEYNPYRVLGSRVKRSPLYLDLYRSLQESQSSPLVSYTFLLTFVSSEGTSVAEHL
jgi:hypothetical protein